VGAIVKRTLISVCLLVGSLVWGQPGRINNFSIITIPDNMLLSGTVEPLPVPNQMTWLLQQNDTGIIALTGSGGVHGNQDETARSGLAFCPNPVNPVEPESFGQTRMSMFVRGTFEAEFNDGVYGGDLDGYLLVGEFVTGSVDGSYLPRNYDNDIPCQNADLPLRRNINKSHKRGTFSFYGAFQELVPFLDSGHLEYDYTDSFFEGFELSHDGFMRDAVFDPILHGIWLLSTEGGQTHLAQLFQLYNFGLDKVVLRVNEIGVLDGISSGYAIAIKRNTLWVVNQDPLSMWRVGFDGQTQSSTELDIGGTVAGEMGALAIPETPYVLVSLFHLTSETGQIWAFNVADESFTHVTDVESETPNTQISAMASTNFLARQANLAHGPVNNQLKTTFAGINLDRQEPLGMFLIAQGKDSTTGEYRGIASTKITIPPGGFIAADLDSFYQSITLDDSLRSVVVDAYVHDDQMDRLFGNYVVGNAANTASGASLAQNGLTLFPNFRDSTPRELTNVGTRLLFGYLPVTNGLTSAPVIVNPNRNNVDVKMTFYNADGDVLLVDETTLDHLDPMFNFAAIANTLLPDDDADVYMVAESDRPLTGTSFIFNTNAEPSMGEVTAIYDSQATRPSHLVYPWVSNNAQFESIVIANNLGDEEVTVELTARRGSGPSASATRTIPAHGFLQEVASSLFPTLGDGSGYAVELSSDSGQVHGRWVTNNLEAASGRSPSQGVAIDLNATDNERVGNALVYGVLYSSGGVSSAPVIVNTGTSATDVTMSFYNSAGELVVEDTQTARGLEPFRPFAAVTSSLLPAGAEDVYMVASSSDQPLTGVIFAFNAFSEPSIGVVKAIANQ